MEHPEEAEGASRGKRLFLDDDMKGFLSSQQIGLDTLISRFYTVVSPASTVQGEITGSKSTDSMKIWT